MNNKNKVLQIMMNAVKGSKIAKRSPIDIGAKGLSHSKSKTKTTKVAIELLTERIRGTKEKTKTRSR